MSIIALSYIMNAARPAITRTGRVILFKSLRISVATPNILIIIKYAPSVMTTKNKLFTT